MSPVASPGDAQKIKRPRTSKPKVKTGCSSCKQRRIKCDEKRPSCSQCDRSRRECPGYPAPSRRAMPFEQVKIAPKATNGIDYARAPQNLATPIKEPVRLPPRRVQKSADKRRASLKSRTSSAGQTAMVLFHSLSSGLNLDQSEGLYFQLFRTHTANELSGFFDNVFWSRSVLQECHSQVAIRHAVVALGALYKTLENAHESPPSSPADDLLVAHSAESVNRHWQVALSEYGKAISALATADQQQDRQGMQRTSLMASVLLACFDSFVGDHRQAIHQIQAGLRLLEEVRAERRRAFISMGEPVEDELIQMFTRLAIQAKSYDLAFHFPQPYVIQLLPPPTDPMSPSSEGGSPVSTHQEPIPDQFGSLLEARVAWDSICERIFRFTELMFQVVRGTAAPYLLPSSMTHHGAQFKCQLDAWSVAFEHLLHTRTAPGVTSQEKAGLAVLKMNQIMGRILFEMTYVDNEMLFDGFRPLFKDIVDLALEVVGDEERRAKEKRCPNPHSCQHTGHGPDIFGGHEYSAHHIKPSFSADLGIVPPLYVTAIKCRDRIIRRQAIQLLRSSARREGMWDSELSARIGTWVTDIEEEEDDVEYLMSPESPLTTFSRPSTAEDHVNGSVDFGAAPLGPGGNAKWDARRPSHVSLASQGSTVSTIPSKKRVLIKACDFNLREHTATLECGSRELLQGAPDSKMRVTQISW